MTDMSKKSRFLCMCALICTLSGCSMFSKTEGSDLEDITQHVLKANRGIDIEIKPIPRDEK